MPAREEPPQGAHAFQELQVKYFNSKATLKHVSQCSCLCICKAGLWLLS